MRRPGCEEEFFGARVCKVTFTQPLRSDTQSFGTKGQHFKFPPLSTQIKHSAGGSEVPNFFFEWNPNINIFVNWEPIQNFRT
jgi:hypothetical protein